jgi:hypothetical protein
MIQSERSTISKGSVLDSLDRTFSHAADAAGGVVERGFHLAGTDFRLRFGGKGLLGTVMPALTHLPPPRGTGPTLRVGLWDRASTGVALPDLPWSRPESLPDGGSRMRLAARVSTAFIEPDRVASFLSPGEGTGFFWIEDPSAVSHSERGAPLRFIISWWAAAHGGQIAHAGAVGRGDRGVLLTGRGGSGKTSSALAALENGLSYAGDDYVLITQATQPLVHAVYSSAKLSPEAARRFPRIFASGWSVAGHPEEKEIAFIHQLRPERVALGFSIKAILVPTVEVRRHTSLQPVSRARALAALAPSTILQLPGAGGGALEAMSRLVRSVPTYALRVGSDLDGVAAAISEALQTGGGS